MMNVATGVTTDTTISMEVEAETGTEGKPTPDELGIDVARLAWQRSGDGDGSIEIAFPLSPRWTSRWRSTRRTGPTTRTIPGATSRRPASR